MKTIASILCCLLIAAPFLRSQGEGPPAPPPAPPLQLDPLVFDPPLPKDPVAMVNGEPVPAADMLKLLLEQNFQTGVAMLVMGLMLDAELTRQEKTVSDEGILDELNHMLEQSSPGVTLEQLQEESPDTLAQMTKTARINRGWKELYWEARAVPADQRHSQTTQFMLQIYLQEVTSRYERRIRGAAPPPPAGFVAQVVDKNSDQDMRISASEALDFLMALVKESGLLDAARDAAERALIDMAMKEANVTVTDQEMVEWAQLQRATYPPPLGWDQICRVKGTTPEREMERWRRIQAWKRITKPEISEEELEKYLEENKSYFLGKTKKVSHILLRDTDSSTGLPLPEEQRAKVKTDIDMMYKKILEGASFEWLAENYSEDPVTARGQGRLGHPLKQFGGSLDPAFHEAAWQLQKVGDISKPVQSAYGWHIIKLDEVNEPSNREPDFKAPNYWAYIVDEYETRRMTAWFKQLKASAQIELMPAEKILAFKNRRYR